LAVLADSLPAFTSTANPLAAGSAARRAALLSQPVTIANPKQQTPIVNQCLFFIVAPFGFFLK
jgi:hypothetical protein